MGEQGGRAHCRAGGGALGGEEGRAGTGWVEAERVKGCGAGRQVGARRSGLPQTHHRVRVVRRRQRRQQRQCAAARALVPALVHVLQHGSQLQVSRRLLRRAAGRGHAVEPVRGCRLTAGCCAAAGALCLPAVQQQAPVRMQAQPHKNRCRQGSTHLRTAGGRRRRGRRRRCAVSAVRRVRHPLAVVLAPAQIQPVIGRPLRPQPVKRQPLRSAARREQACV